MICKSRGFNEPLREMFSVLPGDTYFVMQIMIHDSDSTACWHEQFPSEAVQ